MIVLQYAAVIVVGYLLGSIPFGYIAGRMRGVDVREYGSGRTGGPTSCARQERRLPR